jgi:hypothetical protein
MGSMLRDPAFRHDKNFIRVSHDGQALALAAGKQIAVFAYGGVVALFHFANEAVAVRLFAKARGFCRASTEKWRKGKWL